MVHDVSIAFYLQHIPEHLQIVVSSSQSSTAPTSRSSKFFIPLNRQIQRQLKWSKFKLMRIDTSRLSKSQKLAIAEATPERHESYTFRGSAFGNSSDLTPGATIMRCLIEEEPARLLPVQFCEDLEPSMPFQCRVFLLSS
jgi:hypothetical protein